MKQKHNFASICTFKPSYFCWGLGSNYCANEGKREVIVLCYLVHAVDSSEQAMQCMSKNLQCILTTKTAFAWCIPNI